MERPRRWKETVVLSNITIALVFEASELERQLNLRAIENCTAYNLETNAIQYSVDSFIHRSSAIFSQETPTTQTIEPRSRATIQSVREQTALSADADFYYFDSPAEISVVLVHPPELAVSVIIPGGAKPGEELVEIIDNPTLKFFKASGTRALSIAWALQGQGLSHHLRGI